MRKVLLLGATSAIAQQTAKLFAAKGDEIYIVGRNEEKLKIIMNDLIVCGAIRVHYKSIDLTDTDQHKALFAQVLATMHGLDIILVAIGTLSDQNSCEKDYLLVEREFKSNFLSTVSLLTYISNYFEQQKCGCIVVISSVAGDRGRQSNYIYGSAKGALTMFLQGLRNRLYKSGVSVITIKPGFVDTPMTAHLKKNFLFVKPNTIAKGIYRAIENRNDEVYLPSFWKWIMLIIKCIPESLFKRLNL